MLLIIFLEVLKMKRNIILILAVVFVLMGTQLFAGGSASNAASRPLNVTIWSRDIAVSADMNFYKQLRTQTGIDANITIVNGSEWTTKMNLMFASGDYADIIMRGDVEVEQYGVDQKILIPLEGHIDRYMPNYKALLARDPSLNDYMRASDGHIYKTGFLVPQNINAERHLFVNKSWLDKVNLAVPKTFSELENMLRTFKGKDLNGNGKIDELPLSGIIGSNESILELLSFFGIPYRAGSLWLNITDDNRVVSPLQHQNFRAAMETLARWYSEGLIDVEALTQNTSSFEAKVNNSQVGMFWRWRMKAMLSPDEIVNQYVSILPLAALPGVTPVVNRYLELPGTGAMITTACKDIEKACKWIDAQYTFENMANGYYGPYKEVTQNNSVMQYGWRKSANGKVDFFAADLEEIPNQSALHFFSGPEYFEKFNLPAQRIEKIEYCDQLTKAGMVEKNAATILDSLVKMSPADMAQRDLLRAQIDTFAKESITNFISNGVTNASWNTYTATLQNLRINDYIRLYQNAYDRYRAAQR